MSTTEQLKLRAIRMLHDGRQHSRTARIWARCMTDAPSRDPVIRDGLSRYKFTGRELSLGATNFDVEAR